MPAEQRDGWGERMMALIWRKPAETVGERARRRITVHLIPYLFFLYILAYLDRVNIGFAALQRNQAIGLSASQFGWGAGMMFFSYCLLEVPSNIAMYHFGARRWLARIMITWGLAAAATALATCVESSSRSASPASGRSASPRLRAAEKSRTPS